MSAPQRIGLDAAPKDRVSRIHDICTVVAQALASPYFLHMRSDIYASWR